MDLEFRFAYCCEGCGVGRHGQRCMCCRQHNMMRPLCTRCAIVQEGHYVCRSAWQRFGTVFRMHRFTVHSLERIPGKTHGMESWPFYRCANGVENANFACGYVPPINEYMTLQKRWMTLQSEHPESVAKILQTDQHTPLTNPEFNAIEGQVAASDAAADMQQDDHAEVLQGLVVRTCCAHVPIAGTVREYVAVSHWTYVAAFWYQR